MSPSRDNLPAVEEPKRTTHDALPAVEDNTRRTLGDARIIIGLVVTTLAVLTAVAGGGWKAYAQVREAQAEDNKPLVARVGVVEAKQAAIDASVQEQNRKIANIERVVMTIDLNQRLMLESRGIKPIDVPPSADGGR